MEGSTEEVMLAWTLMDEQEFVGTEDKKYFDLRKSEKASWRRHISLEGHEFARFRG